MAAYRDRRDQIHQHLSRLETLNSHINSAEEAMMSLKLRYENAVKDRNSIGIYLLDRNDELCILYERLNFQKEIASRGEAALVEREEEIRKLTIIGAELDRKIELEKKNLPIIKSLSAEINKLEEKRNILHAECSKLGKQMENPNDPKRCRNLPGQDPTIKDLVQKIEKMEEQLAVQEVLY